jgi:hypothetical protein
MVEPLKFTDLGSFEEFATMEMDRLQKEVERLKKKCDMQAMILRRLTPDQHPNTLFISGILGALDSNGMPKKICVVPAYGVDFSYVYEYNGTNIVQEW